MAAGAETVHEPHKVGKPSPGTVTTQVHLAELWGLASSRPHSEPVCLPISCSDDEKSRLMWRRYQEREDSRISGEQGCGESRAGLGWERG